MSSEAQPFSGMEVSAPALHFVQQAILEMNGNDTPQGFGFGYETLGHALRALPGFFHYHVQSRVQRGFDHDGNMRPGQNAEPRNLRSARAHPFGKTRLVSAVVLAENPPRFSNIRYATPFRGKDALHSSGPASTAENHIGGSLSLSHCVYPQPSRTRGEHLSPRSRLCPRKCEFHQARLPAHRGLSGLAPDCPPPRESRTASRCKPRPLPLER